MLGLCLGSMEWMYGVVEMNSIVVTGFEHSICGGAATIFISWRPKSDNELDLSMPTNWMQVHLPWIHWVCWLPVYVWVLEIDWR